MPDTTPATPATEDPSAGQLARLRDAARRGAQARKETAALRRENAFLRAGVPDAATSPLGALFRKSYEGDDEGIGLAWAEIAPPPVPRVKLDEYGEPITPAAPETVTDPGERAFTQERNTLANAGGYAPPIVRDPRSVADEVSDRMRAEGAREQDILATHFSILARAAQAGDQRAGDNPNLRPRRR